LHFEEEIPEYKKSPWSTSSRTPPSSTSEKNNSSSASAEKISFQKGDEGGMKCNHEHKTIPGG
jgi:hypothetical protein